MTASVLPILIPMNVTIVDFEMAWVVTLAVGDPAMVVIFAANEVVLTNVAPLTTVVVADGAKGVGIELTLKNEVDTNSTVEIELFVEVARNVAGDVDEWTTETNHRLVIK